MDSKELVFFKDLLLQQRSEILNKADSFKSESLVKSVEPGDEGDLASGEYSMAMNLRLHERQHILLHKIDKALSRIDSGSFGLGESCEEPMSSKRLLARPVATLCISCKEDQESRERFFA